MSDVPPEGLLGTDAFKTVSYRVLLFDRDSRVHSSTPLLVADDDAALVAARRMANGLSAELWDGLRYIDRFDGV